MSVLSRLVPVRRFPTFQAGPRVPSVVGVEEQKLLAKAGIESYVKLDRSFGVALVVPEAQAEAARRALAELPDLFKHHTAPPCPRCHTFQPEVRRPYELLPIVIGILTAAGLAIAGLLGLAYGVTAVSVVVAAVMTSHMPPWRCHACGFRYTDPKVP